MNKDNNAPRLLGLAFLIVLISSALSSILLKAAIGSGIIPEILVKISVNITLFRISILVELLTSIGIVALTVLLYTVLQAQNKIIAMVALGFWLAEAITLALSKLGAFSLILLSRQYLQVEALKSSYYSTLSDILYNGIDRTGYGIHFLFYCLGGVLWFYLFYKSNYIPKILSIWGIVAEFVALIAIIIALGDVKVNVLYFAHIAVLELTIGLWLVFKGIRNGFENIPNDK